MGRLNYIARFISQMTAKCDPIFKMLRKHNSGEWDEECQRAFDKVKKYLTNPPVLVPPVQGKPLILYLIVHEKSMGCVLGQHDETRRKEQAIYYLSKKFMNYESRYSLLEKMCCALAWAAQGLKQLQSWIPSSLSLRSPHCPEESQGGKFCYQNSISYMYLRKPSKKVR